MSRLSTCILSTITPRIVQGAFNLRWYLLSYLRTTETKRIVCPFGVTGLIEPDCRFPKVASQDWRVPEELETFSLKML